MCARKQHRECVGRINEITEWKNKEGKREEKEVKDSG